MQKLFLTDDGYLYKQLPDSTWTDGDITFQLHNTDLTGIEIESFIDDGKTVYCADGDGFVTIEHDVNGYSLFDQGEFLANVGDNLTIALSQMVKYLAATYPAIFSNFYISA